MTSSHDPDLELVFFTGCPHVVAARRNLRRAMERTGRVDGWREWDLEDDRTPARVRGFGSPTVLVDGRDVAARKGEVRFERNHLAIIVACRS